jgi:antitoxin component of MazEF toxin-antitoxin module
MPFIRKVVRIGNMRGATFPKSWIEEIERKEGKELRKVSVEINGSITFTPYFEKREVHKK